MRRLLTHINILFTLLFLICTGSVFGLNTGTSIVDPEITATIDSRAVDLGLSVYWANQNVGNNSTKVYDFFAWGDISTSKSSHTLLNYAHYSKAKYTKYTSSDNKTTLEMVDDVANSSWGGHWRTPTRTDFQNLLTNTTISGSTSQFIFTANISGNSVSITLPCNGYWGVSHYSSFPMSFTKSGYGFYWSSSLDDKDKSHAYSLRLYKDGSNFKPMITDDFRYYGYYVRPVIDKCNITQSISVSNKSDMNSSASVSYPKGTVLKAQCGDCYEFIRWEVFNGSVSVKTSSKDTITVLNTGYTYQAKFRKITYTITTKTNNDDWGEVTGGGTYFCGDNTTLTAKSKGCYQFDNWNDGTTDSTRTILVDGDKEFTANFSIKPYSVTATTNNTLGTAVPASASVDCGNSAVVTAKPDNNCVEFLGWDADNDGDIDYAPIHDNPGVSKGEQDTNGDYVLTIYNVTGKIGVKAFFQTKTYAVTASSNNTVGTAAITTNKTSNDIYGCGTKLTLTADPKDSCYYFEKWIETKNGTEKEISPSNNPGTCSTKGGVNNLEVEVDAAATYTACFVQYQYTVTAAPNDGSLGYIVDTISGNNLNPPQTFDVNCGNWITFKARPTDNCISLFRWADDRTTPTVVYTPGHNDEDYSCTTDSNGVNTLIIYNVNKTIPHLYAVFVGNADSTKVESDGGGSASIKVEDGSNICDKIVTLTATAKECYKFSHWTKDTDDNWSGTSSQFTLSPVTEIATYTAHFIQVEEITVTIISEDKNKGTVAFDDGNNEENNQQE